MSTERSSSAVRNLRSLFENKGPEQSPDTRGRSPSHLTEPSPSRPGSKVRASFVSVVPPTAAMASSTTGDEAGGVGGGMADLKRASSAGLRRGSFSENDENSENLLQLKKTVSQEAERRQRDTQVSESIPEHAAVSAAATPNVKASMNGNGGDEQHIEESPLAHKVDQPPANPDKPVTAAEEEPGEMKPADMSSEAAVSGGEALPPKVEDLRKPDEPVVLEAEKTHEVPAVMKSETAMEDSKKPTATKPSPVATKAPAKATPSSTKSPAKATTSPKAASTSAKPTQLSKKASRSSLTAPTAASVARAAGQDNKSNSKPAHPPMPKRDATKPIDLPSRLTAPTAASRARHEPTTATSTAPNNKTSLPSRTAKPSTSSTRPTPRTSLARPESRSSHTTSKKSTASAPVEGSFLERMMRPTAASANKTHEKTEVKSPPRGASKTKAVKDKVNGLVGKKHDAKAEPQPEQAHCHEEEKSSVNGDSIGGGNETPIPASGETNGALEATPAFGEDTIR